MPNKKTRAKKAGRARAKARRPAPWVGAVKAVSTAQANLAREVKKLLQRNRISTKDAASALRDVRALAQREQRKAVKELRARATELQARIHKERRVAARAIDHGVRSALAALNIPSRAEVTALTHKVDELSKRMQRARR
jgi:ubiquinone biosynthesis protein UbiJ